MLSHTQKRTKKAVSLRRRQVLECGSRLTAASFYVRMRGDTMVDAGINDNDILIARPIKRPQNGSIVVAVLNETLVVRRYFNIKNQICLVPENTNYPATEVTQDAKFDICGVVIQVIHAPNNEHLKES